MTAVGKADKGASQKLTCRATYSEVYAGLSASVTTGTEVLLHRGREARAQFAGPRRIFLALMILSALYLKAAFELISARQSCKFALY